MDPNDTGVTSGRVLNPQKGKKQKGTDNPEGGSKPKSCLPAINKHQEKKCVTWSSEETNPSFNMGVY